MSKRFTATEKWSDPWFCGLDPINKLFWVYLLDNCDHAGIWQVNWPLVEFHLGKFVFDEKCFDGRIEQLNSEKWFIPKFVTFQYGSLKSRNSAHKGVIRVLKLNKIDKFSVDRKKIAPTKGLPSPCQGAKDKDKDKDKDNKGGVGGGETIFPPALEMVEAYCLERKNRVDFKRFVDFYTSKGWMVGKNKMKDWKAAIRNWERDTQPVEINKFTPEDQERLKFLNESARKQKSGH